MVTASPFSPLRKPRPLFFRLLPGTFLLGGAALLAHASATTVAAAAAGTDFAPYFAQHQADLGPFFTQNGPVLLKDALPITVTVTSRILLATALACWLLDVLLGWIFSTLAAPAYARITRALVYASGRLVLAVALTFGLGFAALLGLNAGAGWPALLVVVVLTVPAVAIQIYWVGWLYRTSVRESGLFYGVLLLLHTVTGCILTALFFSGQIDHAVARYVDHSITPRLRLAAIDAGHETAGLTAPRDTAQATLTVRQDQLTQDNTTEAALRQSIQDGKNSSAFAFSRLVLLRAQGHLSEAATGLAAFISRYPNAPETDPARGQLAQLNQEVSAQLAAQHQEQAATDREAARARARLLARAAAGQATLSEMRSALLGRTTAQVYALFGAPSERAADRWGYAQRMVADPQDSQVHGLTIVFTDGLVQGVDYYYGVGP